MSSCCSNCCDCLPRQPEPEGEHHRIIFLVNSRSGGRKGKDVLKLLRESDYSAYDLFEFNDNKDLYRDLVSEILEIDKVVVVCFAGGDGTACWAFKTIDRALLSTHGRYRDEPRSAPAGGSLEPSVPNILREEKDNITNEQPKLPSHRGRWVCEDSSGSAHPHYLTMIDEDDRICKEFYESGRVKFCSIPLGTGNDLSRVLGWSNVYCGDRKLLRRVELMTLKSQRLTWLDRWRAVFQTADGEIKEWRSNFMINYLSVGYTADIAYQFDKAREDNRQLYKSIFMNKLKYIQLGAEKAVFNNPNIKPHIQLFVDGKEVQLRDITTLLFHNIRSMSDGIDFWGRSRSREPNRDWDDGRMGDGVMEVTSSNHVTSFVKAKFHLTGYTKVAQGKEICLLLKRAMAIQLDGESWIEEPGILRLSRISRIQVPIGPKTTRGLTMVSEE